MIHNDDPDASEMWMPEGSFWTQPAGEVHITAAKGQENMAYVEIDQGPYLVKPTEEAFDNGEQPINISYENIVWLDASKANNIKAKAGEQSPALSYLWKSKGNEGLFVKLPPNFEGEIIANGSEFRAIVVAGVVDYKVNNEEVKKLDLGSSFSSEEKSAHPLQNLPPQRRTI